MAREWLSYKETLRIVEDFMVKSGIRYYCSEICKGVCCGKCYTSDKACHKNEGRRLSCSTYFCGHGGVVGSSRIVAEIMTPFREAERHIVDQISEAWKELGRGTKYKFSGYVRTPNSYFEVHPKELIKAYKAKRSFVVERMNAKIAKRIRYYMNMIIKVAEEVVPNGNQKDLKIWGRRVNRFRVEHRPGGGYRIYDQAGRFHNL